MHLALSTHARQCGLGTGAYLRRPPGAARSEAADTWQRVPGAAAPRAGPLRAPRPPAAGRTAATAVGRPRPSPRQPSDPRTNRDIGGGGGGGARPQVPRPPPLQPGTVGGRGGQPTSPCTHKQAHTDSPAVPGSAHVPEQTRRVRRRRVDRGETSRAGRTADGARRAPVAARPPHVPPRESVRRSRPSRRTGRRCGPGYRCRLSRTRTRQPGPQRQPGGGVRRGPASRAGQRPHGRARASRPSPRPTPSPAAAPACPPPLLLLLLLLPTLQGPCLDVPSARGCPLGRAPRRRLDSRPSVPPAPGRPPAAQTAPALCPCEGPVSPRHLRAFVRA
jgi:hypothetical protein